MIAISARSGPPFALKGRVEERAPAPSTQSRSTPGFGYAPMMPVARDPLRIVYTNDTHEKYQSLLRAVTAYQRFNVEGQAQGRDVLNLAAGDWNIGTEPNELELNVLLHNLMGINYSTLGNHEFDTKPQALADALGRAGFTTITTNLSVSPNSPLSARVADGKLALGPRVFVSPRGVRYGIVGITVPEYWKYVNPASANLQGLSSANLDESIKKLQADVDALERSGVHKIICLSHAGYQKDLQIAARTRGIDVLQGGHSHTELQGIVPGINFVRSATGEPVMIVQTGKDAHALGVLDLSWDAGDRVIPERNILHNPRYYPSHPMAAMLADRYLGPERYLATVAQDHSTDNVLTGGENGFANLAADAIYNYTGTDVVIFRGNNVRNDIMSGPFTTRDLKVLLPFSDKLVAVKMTGAQLMEALNDSADALANRRNHPGILHPAGLRYTVDPRSGRTVDARIFNRQSGVWEPLQMDKSYTVASGSFIIDNKKEFPVFKRVPVLYRYPLNEREVLGNYLSTRVREPLNFPVDGRLTVLEHPAWPHLMMQPASVPLSSQPSSGSAFPRWNAIASAHGYTSLPTSTSPSGSRLTVDLD